MKQASKTVNGISFVLVCFLVILAGAGAVEGQDRVVQSQSASEVEQLRRQVEAQNARIEELQTALKKGSEQQDKQQQLLEALQQKVEQLSATGTPTTAEKPSALAAPSQLAVTQDQQEATKSETIPNKTADVKPQAVQAGYGKIKFNGLLQGWYQAGNGGFTDSFRMRRAELKFTGEITPEVKWTVMVDPTKALSLNNTFFTNGGTTGLRDTNINQGSRILQDAFITLSYFKRMNVNVGQFKVPLSLEGLQSSAGLDTERALFASDRARGGTYGDIRDIGVMFYGPLSKHVDYQLGVFNGSGENQNDLDKNDQKAIAGRLIGRPTFIRGLQIGGSGVWGNGERADRPRRDRLGVEMLYQRGPLTLKSELMTGKDGPLSRKGYYGHVAYHFTPKWEGIFRFDSWDPDTSKETNALDVTERDYVAGFNYFITDSHVKFQFNYLRKTFANGIVPSRNLAVLRLQTWW